MSAGPTKTTRAYGAFSGPSLCQRRCQGASPTRDKT
jgi:hypothetical protein